MKRNNLTMLVTAAALAALTCVATMVVNIPIPGTKGYVNAGDCVALLSGHRPMLIKSFLFNLLQRASQIAVTMLVYLAMGGRTRQAIDIFAMQSYVVLGSNCVPIPGAMGVADYLMLDGFNAFLAQDQVAAMELLSRTISFYSCVLLCGITVLIVTHKLRKVVRR